MKTLYAARHIGEKHGKLTILSVDGTKNGKSFVLCQCDCGNQKVINLANILKKNDTKSCGCLKAARNLTGNPKHGIRYHRLYEILMGMKKRCYNKNAKSYKNYGGRGIVICKEWLNDINKFYNWSLENGYKDSLTIERINNDGNYEPDNCTFIPKSKQVYNKRGTTSLLKVKSIREFKRTNSLISNREIASKFKLSIGTVQKIVTYKTFSDI
jgi:hypothetical protein